MMMPAVSSLTAGPYNVWGWTPNYKALWVAQMGVAAGITQVKGVAVDSSGNVFAAGFTNGNLDGNTLTGTQDIFITKYASTGTKQWTKQLGASGGTIYALGVAVDTLGNVFAGGYTNVGLDGNTLTGTNDLFVTKYNSAGVKQWTKQLGVATKAVTAWSVATDSTNSVFIGGYVNGGLDGNTLTGTADFFITKYDGSGVKQFTKQLGVATKPTFGYAIATDSSDNFYITGATGGGLDGNTLTGTQDLFVTKYNSAGTKQWTKQLGVATGTSAPAGLKVDNSGNVYTVGQTNKGLDGNALVGTGDIFMTAYDSTGTKLWTKELGVAGAASAAVGVTVNSAGNIYVVGYTAGGLDGNTLTGTFDVTITAYNSSGTKLWTKQKGVAAVSSKGNSAAADGSGKIVMGGTTGGGFYNKTLTGTTDYLIISTSDSTSGW